MSVAAITPTHPACYGVCCPKHGQCVRYEAVEAMTSSQLAIATCETQCGARPLFLHVVRAVQVLHLLDSPQFKKAGMSPPTGAALADVVGTVRFNHGGAHAPVR